MLKTLFKRAAVVASLCVATMGAAQAGTWFLSGVTFNDGAAAKGWFTYDAATATVLDYELETMAGPLFPYFKYDPSNSEATKDRFVSANNPSIAWTTCYLTSAPDTPDCRYFNLTFSYELPDAGGSIEIRRGPQNTNGSWEHSNFFLDASDRFIEYPDDSPAFLVSGDPVPDTSSVPEPATYTMVIAGLVVIGALARRRKARVG